MKAGIWMLIIVVSVTIASAALIYVYYIDDKDDTNDKIQNSEEEQARSEEGDGTFNVDSIYSSEPPSPPIFSSQDNAECRKNM